METRIQKYRFSDSKAGIISAAAIHLLCGLLLIMASDQPYITAERAQLCLAIALIFTFLYKSYDWKDTTMNLLMIIGYGIGLIIEWSFLGLPEPSLTMSTSGYSKGFMMSFMMEMVPWFYAGLRILCVLLLFHISWEAYRLKSLE